MTFEGISISMNMCGWIWAVRFNDGTKKTGFGRTYEVCRKAVQDVIDKMEPADVAD